MRRRRLRNGVIAAVLVALAGFVVFRLWEARYRASIGSQYVQHEYDTRQRIEQTWDALCAYREAHGTFPASYDAWLLDDPSVAWIVEPVPGAAGPLIVNLEGLHDDERVLVLGIPAFHHRGLDASRDPVTREPIGRTSGVGLFNDGFQDVYGGDDLVRIGVFDEAGKTD